MLPRKSELNSELLPSMEQSGASQPSKPSSVSVIKSFEVNAFKCIDGKYELQGRHGVAVISNPERTDFKLLLFAKGGKPVSQAILHPLKNCLTIPQSLYVTLLDAYNIYWSLLFDNDERFHEFICQVCIVRLYGSDASHIVEQVVSAGEGESVEMNDVVEIQYTGWLVEQNCTRGQVFDTNLSTAKTQRIKLGQTGIIKGLSNALLGCKKNCVKIVAIPPALAYGKGGMPPKIPGNHALLFLMSVLRVKCMTKTKGDDDDVSILSETLQASNKIDEAPLPLLPNDNEEQSLSLSVKDRTKSISEKLEQPVATNKTTKTELLNRMAKMGQAVLTGSIGKDPLSDTKNSVSLDESDSESLLSTQEMQYRLERKADAPFLISQPQQQPHPMQQTFLPNSTVIPAAQALMPYQHPFGGSYFQPNLPVVSNPSSAPFIAAPPQTTYNKENNDLHIAMLVNETRQQNVEMRVIMSRLEEKVEKLRDRIDDSRHASGDTCKYPSLESGMLLQNLTRIIRENDALKEELYAKNMKIEELSKRVTSFLVDQHARIEQENNDIERRSSVFKLTAIESQSKLLALEEEKLRLGKELSQRINEVYDLQKAYDEIRDSHRSLCNLHEPLKREVEDLKAKLLEVSESKNQFETSVAGLQRLLKAKEAEVIHLNEQINASQVQGLSQETVASQRIKQLEELNKALENEIDTSRQEAFQKIDSLQRKLREDKSLALETESRLRNEIEEQYMNQWKKKCDDMVTAESIRKARQIGDLQEEKQHLTDELASLQARFDDFKSKTRAMKTQLVSQITELQNQIDGLNVELEDARNSSEMDHSEMVVKVKGIMNAVYQDLKSKFQPQKAYKGAVVLQTGLKIIRRATLRITQNVESESDEDTVEEVVSPQKSVEPLHEIASSTLKDSTSNVANEKVIHATVPLRSPAMFNSTAPSPAVESEHITAGTNEIRHSPKLFHEPAVQEPRFEDQHPTMKSSPPSLPKSPEISIKNQIADVDVNETNVISDAVFSSTRLPNSKDILSISESPIVTPAISKHVDGLEPWSASNESPSDDIFSSSQTQTQSSHEIPTIPESPILDVADSKNIRDPVALTEAGAISSESPRIAVFTSNPLPNNVPSTLKDIQEQIESVENTPVAEVSSSRSATPIHSPENQENSNVDGFSQLENTEEKDSPAPVLIEDQHTEENIENVLSKKAEDSDFIPAALIAPSNEPPLLVEDPPIAAPLLHKDSQPLFSDDEDADSKSFLQIISNTKPETKKSTLATDRVPPPLFSDTDDDDISWLH